MKSRGFSPDLHYFKYVVKRYSWLALISLIVIGYHTWAGWFLFDWDASGVGYFMIGDTGEYLFGGNFPDAASFSIINYGAELGNTLPYASAIVGIIYALTLFGFLWKKNECFTTLSHGVSLRNQFLIRYIFGAGLITLCDALSFGLSYIIQLNLIGGDTTELTLPYSLCYFAVHIVLELCIYTLSVLIAVLSGRFLDCLLSVGGIIAAPYAIGNMLRHIFANFLHGSALGLPKNSIILGSSQLDNFRSILEHTDKLGAFTAFADTLEGVSIPANGTANWLNDFVIEAYRKEFITIPYLPFFLTLAITVIFAFFACLFFIRRPAEYAGKAGIYPPVYITSAILAAIGISSFVGELTLNRYLLVLLICAAFALTFFILIAVYKASVKACFEHYLSAIGAVSGILLCVLICFFGAFGYSNYIPETAEIESVIVNYIGNPVILSGSRNSMYSSGYSLETNYTPNGFNQISGSVKSLARLNFWTYVDDMPVLTDEADIEAAREIHRYIIDEGMKSKGDCKQMEDTSESVISCNYYIVYTLKDGTRVERFYKYLTLSSIEKLCSIETGKAFRENYLNNRLSPEADIYKSGETTFEAADEFFSDIIPLDMLTTEQNDALFEALTYDFADLSYEDRYFSNDEVLGIIRFKASYKATGDGTLIYYDGGRSPENDDGSTWYITEKYTRTLDFLEDNGLMYVFDGQMTVLGIEIIEFDPYSGKKEAGGYGTLFAIQSFDNVIHTERGTQTTPVPEAEWDYYLENSRAIAATTRGGTIVQIIYRNSSGTVKIIDRLMPNE